MNFDEQILEADVAAGQQIYSPAVLRLYDLWVLGISNRWIWRCPTPLLLQHVNRHIGGAHLDLGVGSGYYLDRCRFPATPPQLTLLDLNSNSLAHTARRVARYRPHLVQGDVFAPPPLKTSFASIGMMYLLHCLPGNMDRKAAVFGNFKNKLHPGGIIFGATLLGEGAEHSSVAQRLMRLYNQKGIFSNRHDTATALQAALQEHFTDVHMERRGSVAMFSGRRPD